MTTRQIIGNYERISFPEFGISGVVAKIDTGAGTGAFHCTKIIETKKIDGTKEIHFSPFDHPEITIKTSNYTEKTVRSSNGVGEKRYFISTSINITGKNFPIDLSLSDRSNMKYPVLLGSKFMQKNNFLVDVSIDNG